MYTLFCRCTINVITVIQPILELLTLVNVIIIELKPHTMYKVHMYVQYLLGNKQLYYRENKIYIGLLEKPSVFIATAIDTNSWLSPNVFYDEATKFLCE